MPLFQLFERLIGTGQSLARTVLSMFVDRILWRQKASRISQRCICPFLPRTRCAGAPTEEGEPDSHDPISLQSPTERTDLGALWVERAAVSGIPGAVAPPSRSFRADNETLSRKGAVDELFFAQNRHVSEFWAECCAAQIAIIGVGPWDCRELPHPNLAGAHSRPYRKSAPRGQVRGHGLAFRGRRS